MAKNIFVQPEYYAVIGHDAYHLYSELQIKCHNYRISSVIRVIFLPKQSQRSRSVLKDGSRSLALFRKSKIGIIAKFHRTDLVI